MGDDLDLLDDMFGDEAAKKARAVGKFQPKPKFRPQKKGSATASIASSKADSALSELSKPIETAKPVEQCSTVEPNDNAVLHSVTEMPAGEKANIFTGLEALGDSSSQTSIDKECYVPTLEAVALNVSNIETIGERSGTPILSSVEDSADTCKVADVPTVPGMSADVAPVTAGEPILSSTDSLQDQMRNGELGGEEMDVLDPINMIELTAKSGRTTRKFQPKSKLQMQNKSQGIEPVSDSVGSQCIPPDIDYAEKGSVPISQQDDVLDLSSLGFAHTLPTEGTSELHLNEESMDLEVAQLDSCIHLEAMPEVPAKLASRRAKTGDSKTLSASGPSSQQHKGSTSSQENEIGRSLRPRKDKTNICELVDEGIDEVLARGEISEECPQIEGENINNDEVQIESESQKKKVKRKSKRTDDGTEKPARKSKKAKEASDQEGAKRKKFSHSTRRTRVDKTLLETPEDEIDYTKVPLRALIQLAEHREKEMKQGGAAAGAPATNQSNGNSSGLYNDEYFTSEQGGEDNAGEDAPMVDNTEYFNYHHYMKASKTRWSKQETELFYKAIGQFGTDFSMIEMLFPDRSCREIKLKYKKEERQHPLRLREAFTSRSEDFSLFETVKEHLKKIADEENQNADNDDPVDLTEDRGADEGTLNADDDQAKEEHVEEKQEEHEAVANDSGEVQAPTKLDDDDEEDDDFLRWSQYKSDI